MKKLAIKPGEPVAHEERLYRIESVPDFDFVMAKDEETGETRRLPVSELALPVDPDVQDAQRLDLMHVDEADWEVARQRLEIIRPILEADSRTVALVEAQAGKAGVHRATVYRWLDLYERSDLLSSLLPVDRSAKRGSRLSDDLESIIKETINDTYLNMRKPSVAKTYEELRKRCRNAGLKAPHVNTLRNRVSEISEKEKAKKRKGKKASEKFDPIQGKYTDAKSILSVIQIDHTPANIMIVDDVNRKSIGRPWITVAIDVYSRMVAGFYVSLNPPSTDSVGLCLSQAFLPKDQWLAKFDINTPWPVWGLPDAVHADNAKEFRSKVLSRAGDEYGVDIYWRPVAKPRYGAHIERLLGTFKRDIETIPGTTFANVEDKGEYPSEKEAVMTLSEFEEWLTIYVVERYHQYKHGKLDMPPIKKWSEGVFGNDLVAGRGLPDKVADEERLYIDFLPYEERTVQNYGIVWDEIYYYSYVLNRWINAKDPDNPRQKRRFIVRRNPRDISVLYFFDPETKDYYEIPYRDSSRPVVSLWEVRKARQFLKDQGTKEVDEDLIFDALERMQKIVEDATRETKHVRRSNQRRKQDRQSKKPETPESNVHVLNTKSIPQNITPFDEMEDV